MKEQKKPSQKIRPKKYLGQNFLTHQKTARAIVDLAELKGGDTVLEIGPGKGVLTEHLVSRAGRIIAVEYDPRMVAFLGDKFKNTRNLEIFQADALTFPLGDLPPGTKVVANLPYHIATAILFRLLSERDRFSLFVLMFQREVAQRIVAAPGSKVYGSLSIAVQFAGETRKRLKVPRSAFLPPPKVDSAVITLVPFSRPPVQVRDEKFFLKLVRDAFGHRRKSLKNALKEAGYPEAPLRQALGDAGIAPLRRPETLGLEEFAALADYLFVTLHGL